MKLQKDSDQSLIILCGDILHSKNELSERIGESTSPLAFAVPLLP
jgi:hypothetical protein